MHWIFPENIVLSRNGSRVCVEGVGQGIAALPSLKNG